MKPANQRGQYAHYIRLISLTASRCRGRYGAMRVWSSFFLVFLFSNVLLADSERMPEPLLFVSPTNQYYFKLEPADNFRKSDARGALYKVQVGKDEVLYRSDGWYSFNVVVSSDGRFIARRGPWPRYDSVPEETPAVIFYDGGEISRIYYVADLIQDQSKLQKSVSHYSWGSSLRWSEPWSKDIVEIKTIEDQTIRFNIVTGEIEK